MDERLEGVSFRSITRNGQKKLQKARPKKKGLWKKVREDIKKDPIRHENLKSWQREKWRRHRKNNTNHSIRWRLGTRVYMAVKKQYGMKSKSTMELIGCTVQELREHIEKQFKSGMSWDNYGQKGWQIDHIRPCASFDLKIPKQQAECFHYSNLQPLWRSENLSKGDKIL